MTVFAINIGLVILGIVIPFGMVVFWSRVAKTFGTQLNKPHGVILNGNTYKFTEWIYHHKSKFNILMISIVTIVEFLALIPF
jgi:hypothetical protein